MISVLAADGRRFEPLTGGDAAAQAAVMSAEGTVDSDALGPRGVRDRAPVYLSDLKAPGAGIGSMAALPLLTEVGALGYLGVWWISQDGRRLAWITTAGEEVRERFPDLPMDVPAAATDAARTGSPVIIRRRAEYEQRYPGRETLRCAEEIRGT